jgi:hypothetical protein
MTIYSTYCAFAPKWWVVFKNISTPPFFEDENIFQKSARVVVILLQFRFHRDDVLRATSEDDRRRVSILFAGV